eukprot:INCI663.3.p1 GENE.INCI663.3~~INCI663.3.p1  ORF type:complete len:566 (+),score=115.68 INCI663.3:200-1897(+)
MLLLHSAVGCTKPFLRVRGGVTAPGSFSFRLYSSLKVQARSTLKLRGRDRETAVTHHPSCLQRPLFAISAKQATAAAIVRCFGSAAQGPSNEKERESESDAEALATSSSSTSESTPPKDSLQLAVSSDPSSSSSSSSTTTTTTAIPTLDNNVVFGDEEEPVDEFEAEKIAVTKAGIYANIGLAVTKSGVGFLAGSASLLADGLHSLSDLASDVVTFGVLKITHKPANSRYPWGYGRFDALGTLAVAALLVGGSCAIGYSSLEALVAASSSNADGFGDVAGALHHEGIQYAGPALGVAAASVAVKELLYRKTLDVGKKSRSNVIIANAWHHRSDALSSVIAMAGIAGAMADIPVLDTFGGLLVSGMILKAGVEMGWDAVQELSDASVQQRDIVKQILRMTAQNKKSLEDDIFGVHNVRARRMGHYTIVDLHVEVDPQLSISMAYAAAARLREQIISQIPEVIDVSTQLEPFNPKEHARVHLRRIDRLRRGLGSSSSPQDLVFNPRHHWLNFDDGLHTGAKSTKSQAAVAAELEAVIQALPVQVEVTHLTCHILEDRLTASTSFAPF